MLYAYDQIFDVTENLENFCEAAFQHVLRWAPAACSRGGVVAQRSRFDDCGGRAGGRRGLVDWVVRCTCAALGRAFRPLVAAGSLLDFTADTHGTRPAGKPPERKDKEKAAGRGGSLVGTRDGTGSLVRAYLHSLCMGLTSGLNAC